MCYTSSWVEDPLKLQRLGSLWTQLTNGVSLMLMDSCKFSLFLPFYRKADKKEGIKEGVAKISFLWCLIFSLQNKQQRTAVREAVLKSKNPLTVLSEIEEIEKMGKFPIGLIQILYNNVGKVIAMNDRPIINLIYRNRGWAWRGSTCWERSERKEEKIARDTSKNHSLSCNKTTCIARDMHTGNKLEIRVVFCL